MELVENAYISDFTKKTLEQFGWRANDPIPADLGAFMLQVKESLPPSSRIDVMIDKDQMKEEDVEKIKTLLKQAKETLLKKSKEEEFEKEAENMTDSVREALAKFSAASETETEIIDDREPAPEKAAQTDEAPTPESTDDKPAEPPVDPDITPPMAIFPFCPRCGWDMAQKYDVEVTENDKEDFLITVLGGGRFKRDYELMGGKMILRFRSMLADENFLVQRQLLLDQNENGILSEAEWFVKLFEYRMACSLEAVYDANKKPIMLVPELHEFKVESKPDKPNQTPLVAARDYVHSKVLAHEVTRRLAAAHLRRFQRLVESMEAMALEPSFWNGIGSQP